MRIFQPITALYFPLYMKSGNLFKRREAPGEGPPLLWTLLPIWQSRSGCLYLSWNIAVSILDSIDDISPFLDVFIVVFLFGNLPIHAAALFWTLGDVLNSFAFCQ
jgi:hypothetical protein